MPVTLALATNDQSASYLISVNQTLNALEHSLFLLDLLIPSQPFAQRTQLTLQEADIQSQYTKTRAQLSAFLAGSITIEPPDAPTVASVTAIAQQLDNLTANATTAVAVIALATNLINTFNTAVSPPAPAGGGAAPAVAIAAAPAGGGGAAAVAPPAGV